MVVYFIYKERSRKVSLDAMEQLTQLLDETRKVTDGFTDQLSRQTDLAKQNLAELDSKIDEARAVSKGLETLLSDMRSMQSYSRDDVIKLSRGGYQDVEISKITGIPVGEVQLMVSLDAQEQ